MSSFVRVRAPAKINLFLEITGKRPDGYHTLSTVFQTISLADGLTLEPSRDINLTCSEPTLPTDARNIVYRAALELQAALNEKKGVQIHLNKVIPMGAGLGGGSSDAAAVMRGLLKFWKRRIASAALKRLAVRLGADVPFFLDGGTCRAGGIGDQLRSLPQLRKTWLVVVYPGFGVSTQEAYGRVKLPQAGRKSIQKILAPLRRTPKAWAGYLFNRFEEVVFPAYPMLAVLKRDLLNAGAAGALMSGSGSSVFGVAHDARQGKMILSKIRRNYPQSWLVHTI